MNTTPDESALQELTNRLARLEQANADLQEKLAIIQAERAIAGEQPIPHRPGPPPPGPPAAFSSALAGIPAVDAIGTLGADGIDASSDSGNGMHAVAGGASPGALPFNLTAAAIFAEGGSNSGVVGTSNNSAPIFLNNIATDGGAAIVGAFDGQGEGVGNGVLGVCSNTPGNILSEGAGVHGICEDPFGIGVAGSGGQYGVQGDGPYGVSGLGSDIGVYANNFRLGGPTAYLGTRSLAGDFYGEVFFNNKITKLGGGFQIDHPLNPAQKYLSHSFVESPDMKNIYDGMVVLDANGEAEVKLPEWFQALNSDFRYQLTCLGGYAPVYIAGEIHDHGFTIAGGRAGMKISWQVTGTRQDVWAKAHRVRVESEKPVAEQGYYLAPELHGESEEKSIRWARYLNKKTRDCRDYGPVEALMYSLPMREEPALLRLDRKIAEKA